MRQLPSEELLRKGMGYRLAWTKCEQMPRELYVESAAYPPCVGGLRTASCPRKRQHRRGPRERIWPRGWGSRTLHSPYRHRYGRLQILLVDIKMDQQRVLQGQGSESRTPTEAEHDEERDWIV